MISTWLRTVCVCVWVCVIAVVSTEPICDPTNAFIQLGAAGELLLCDKPWRFAGANMHWLALAETKQGLSHPSDFRVIDGLTTAKGMGALVVRSHSLGLSIGGDKSRLASDPTDVNANAVDRADFVLETAKQKGLRVIIPLTDEIESMRGSRRHFTEWKGLEPEQFYTDEGVIEDFLKAVEDLVTHVNPRTGLALKDDPTILGWETGNRIEAPAAWTEKISKRLKALAPRQLVIDGSYLVTSTESDAALEIKDVDIYLRHYPPGNWGERVQSDAAGVKAKGKVLIVGEVSWISDWTHAIEILTAVQHSPSACSISWSLLPHNDYSGFVTDTAKSGAVHFPGDSLAMRNAVDLFMNHDYHMQGLSKLPDGVLVPSQPLVTLLKLNCEFDDASTDILGADIVVQWRGAALSDTYIIEMASEGRERAEVPEEGWAKVCLGCVSDLDEKFVNPFHQPLNGRRWVRMQGVGRGGEGGEWSEPVHLNLENAAKNCVALSPAMKNKKANHFAATLVAVLAIFSSVSAVAALIWFLCIRDGDVLSQYTPGGYAMAKLKRGDSADQAEDDGNEDGRVLRHRNGRTGESDSDNDDLFDLDDVYPDHSHPSSRAVF